MPDFCGTTSRSRPLAVAVSSGDVAKSKSGPCTDGQLGLSGLRGGHCQIHTSLGTVCFTQRMRPSRRSKAMIASEVGCGGSA